MRAALHSDIRLLNEANESILSHNGKMIRPAMALLFARACAGTCDRPARRLRETRKRSRCSELGDSQQPQLVVDRRVRVGDQVLRISDRVTILRAGRTVETVNIGDVTGEELANDERVKKAYLGG
jgi:geranylgeranyl pyrophosphate synthase